jgi:hypothetical protein
LTDIRFIGINTSGSSKIAVPSLTLSNFRVQEKRKDISKAGTSR